MLAAEAGSIEPGTTAENVVLVRNTGDQPDEFNVTIQGPASAWAAIEPTVLRLEPEEEGAAWIRFQPPRTHDTLPGPVPFSVVVASRNDLAFTAIEPGHVEVGGFSRVHAHVDPDGARAEGRWASYTVSVTNDGNRAAAVTLEPSDPSGVFIFDHDPEPVTVGPGQHAEVPVRVRAARRWLPGRADERRFIVSVAADGLEVQSIEVALDQPTVLGKELRRSAIALGVTLVVFAIIAQAVVRSHGNNDNTPSSVTTVPTEPSTSEVATDDGAENGTSEPTPTTEAAAATPGADAAGPPADLAKLVFVRTYGAGDHRDIVVRDAGAAGVELRLRSDDSTESRPVLSPDRTRVAYIRDKTGVSSVCVIGANGGEATCPADASPYSSVAWKSDNVLVFSRGSDLFSLTLDAGTEPEKLPVEVGRGLFVLSADGTRVAYVDGQVIAIRPLDGSAGLNIKVAGEPDGLAWSPDGARLAFSQNFQICTVPAGSGPVHQLTRPETVNGEPAWSPDGNWIIFRSNRTGNGDLYAVHPGTGLEPGLARVTSAPERDGTPAF